MLNKLQSLILRGVPWSKWVEGCPPSSRQPCFWGGRNCESSNAAVGLNLCMCLSKDDKSSFVHVGVLVGCLIQKKWRRKKEEDNLLLFESFESAVPKVPSSLRQTVWAEPGELSFWRWKSLLALPFWKCFLRCLVLLEGFLSKSKLSTHTNWRHQEESKSKSLKVCFDPKPTQKLPTQPSSNQTKLQPPKRQKQKHPSNSTSEPNSVPKPSETAVPFGRITLASRVSATDGAGAAREYADATRMAMPWGGDFRGRTQKCLVKKVWMDKAGLLGCFAWRLRGVWQVWHIPFGGGSPRKLRMFPRRKSWHKQQRGTAQTPKWWVRLSFFIDKS